MAFREDEAIPVRPGRLIGADAHDVEVEGRQDVCRGQWPAEVAGLGLVDSANDAYSDASGDILELAYLLIMSRRGHDRPFSYEPGTTGGVNTQSSSSGFARRAA